MSSSLDPDAMMASAYPSVCSLSQNPLPSDSHPTATLTEQSETEQIIKQLLDITESPETAATSGVGEEQPPTTLRRGEHNVFLASTLYKLPAPFVALDASKPWLIFWTVHSLDLLGITLDRTTKDRAISTLVHFLSPLGGFGGGPGQNPHLLPTYASTCSLAIVGDAGPSGGWVKLAERRQETYDFFMRCKRPDGGFVVCDGGEVDVRGTYCLLVVATLLDILTPELLHNVDEFIASCQTYEGGFACSTYSTDTASPAMAEAHGGYSSCSVLAHFLLSSAKPPLPSTSSLGDEYPRGINVDAALRWSVLMQGEAIEAGGFKGRSNKLVDGCYSWWVGGGFPVLEELVRRKSGKEESDGGQLFNRVALQEFVLVAAQREPGNNGGLRDKPGKRPDLYHTCNNLSGLSIAQHHTVHSPSAVTAKRKQYDPSKGLPAIKPTKAEGGWESEEERQAVRKEVWANALGWVERSEHVLGAKENRVNPTAPVFNILLHRLEAFINYFYGQS